MNVVSRPTPGTNTISPFNASPPAASANPLPAVGRILLSLIYIDSGYRQLGAIGATSATMASHGIPYSGVLVWGAVALGLGGGLMLATGLLARWAALALCLYTLTLALLFHAYWTFPAAAAHAQRTDFITHFGLMGGLLYVVAFGAGAYSFDALLQRRR